MGFMDEYNALKKKRKEEETANPEASFMDRYNELKQERTEPVNLDNIYYDDNTQPEDMTMAQLEAIYPKIAPKMLKRSLNALVNRDGPQVSQYERQVYQIARDNGIGEFSKRDTPRDATLWDLTWNSFTKGINNSRLGEESFAAMQGLDNDREVYKQILSGDEYNFSPDGWLEEGVSGAFELAGQIARQFTHPRTMGVTGAAVGTAAIAGQLGPQVIVPEEIITVPVAALAGLAAGNAASALEIEAGHAYDEMIELGINPDTASAVALAIGTVNAGLEALQVDTLLDAYKLASKAGAGKSFTKIILKELANRGIDVAKETAQEVAQEGVTMAGVQIAHQTEKGGSAYSSDEVKDRLLNTAKHSALSFGMMNVPAAVNNTAVSSYQQSATTKLTDNEQKVVDKVVEDEIANREKDGNKLKASEKSKIKELVKSFLEKGSISTDTIEEVLGGETYKTYKDTVDSEDAQIKLLEDQIKELGDAPNTVANSKKFDSLQQQMDELKNNSKRDQLKLQLSNEVFDRVKDSRLAESYNENGRRSQAFEADLTKYDEKQRETIQRAIDSGILNNTNRTHEFVGMVAKVSADKGVLFDFTNNEKLKDSVFAVEGKTVNGYFDKQNGVVGVNIDSAKALNTVVGHEITHVLEGTELYDAMKETLFEYAKSKGEYQSRYDSLVELYKDVNDVDIESELAADLVGDYLFTDADFINHLSTKNRNVFQKIYDELMYLYKVAASGSKEARELEKVKKAFERAYREGGKATADTKYSISETTDGRLVAVVDNDILSNIDTSRWDKSTKKEVKKAANEELKKFAGGFTINGIEFVGNKDSRDEYTRSNYSEALARKNPTAYLDKMRATDVLDDVIQVATEWQNDNELTHDRDDYVDFVRGKTLIMSGDRAYSAVVLAGVTSDGKAIFHDVEDIYPTSFELKKSEPSTAASANNSPNAILEDSDAPNVAQNVPEVKGKFSRSDSDGKQLSNEKINRVTEDGMTMTYVRVPNQNTQNYGSTYGQNIEPAGEYMNMDTMQGKHKIDGYEYGTIQFKKPLVLEHINTSDTGWKKTVSDMYNGLTGKKLTEALIKDGYDAIVTYDDYGYNEIVNLNGKKLSDQGVRFSLSEAVDETAVKSYAEITEEQQNLYQREMQLQAQKREAENNPELLQAMDDFSSLFTEMRDLLPKRHNGTATQAELDRIEEIKVLREERLKRVADLQESLGLNAIAKEEAEIRETKESLRVAADAAWAREGAEKENKAIEKAGVPAAEYFRKKALKAFKTTTNFNEAGYMLPDGKLLNFSGGERNHRYRDHREIGEIYEATQGVAALNRFMRDGNIRIMAESPGIDLTSVVEPTKEQYAALRKFINTNGSAEGQFFVDFSGTEGERVGNYSYNGRITADRIINDIKYFYQNGKVRESSGLLDFLSLSAEGEQPRTYGNYNISGKDVALDKAIAPVAENVTPVQESVQESVQETVAPVAEETELFPDAPFAQSAVSKLEQLNQQKEALEGQQTMFEGAEKANETIRQNKAQKQAQILTEEPKVVNKKTSAWNLFKDNFVDKGTVFETMSLKTGNRELQAKWKAIGRAESSAQWFMENGNSSTSSLKSIRDTVEKSGKTKQFYEYLYHRHNVDRMNLKNRYPDMENKPVFGYDVTSEMSQKEAAKLETENPEFKDWANDVYSYMNNLREKLVDGGVISAETAKLWSEMYPNYVPIRRVGDEGLNINVALDSKRTGVNAPIKKATGGNRDILPLFDTMAMRTEQTFKAIARNRFGVELKNMLGTTIENQAVGIDESIDSVETELLQEGKDGRNPTFTVFENGEKVTFEITDEMYDTMKPKSKAMGYTNKFLNTANNIRRGLLTEYNPAFMLTNPIKDTQDVLINSQHPARTYANYPKAIAELIGKGQYYQEYMENGGQQNTYFDGESKTFTKEKSDLSKVIGFPLEKISQANNFIERVPRMAEYIASRQEGRSIDVSMLDAARVTTDFSAGGDLVKFANRNGFTFLNASVQGAVQQVRNVREAKAAGLKGWAKLAAKASVAGFSALLLNNMLWDDDEEYEELSDYVKQNYYIVGKYGDGKFVRIPKGRALAVIQNAFEQMENLVTGNDEVDLGTFGELVISNLAPNNPLENNLIAPITQALDNKTWYGDDLVPTRLQDLPTEEQYDETTDSISKWLGEHTPISPYKWNYLLDQYSGAIGDVFLPMITPEAERGNDTAAGNLIAPLADKFTTDGVMKNQNISDFYDKKDELTTNAKASGATEEDVLMNKYMNSINSELSELYAQKREIQNSDLSNAEKYNAVRDIQKQIVDLTRESLSTYDNIDYQSARDGEYVNIGNRYFKKDDKGEWQKLSDEQVTKYKVTSAAGDSSYASDGTNHYRWYTSEDGEAEGWRKVTDKELERQSEVTEGLGISPEDYWNNKDEYSYAYDHPENYAVAKAVGGYESYRSYSKDLYDIKADKDKNGKSISGSRKEKVVEYINGLDADYGEKIILLKSEYPSDDTYNYEIIDYLNGRDDISYSEMETILKELGFKVSSDGTITWD